MRTEVVPPALVTALMLVLCVCNSASCASLDQSELTKPYYDDWLLQVAPIIGDQERRVFSGLQTDLERERFIEEFWKVRDPEPGTDPNPVRQRFLRNSQLAGMTLQHPQDHRAQTIVLQGPPRYSYEIVCSGLFPLHLFYYPSNESREKGFVAVFQLHPEEGPFYTLWSRNSGHDRLVADKELLDLPLDALLERVLQQGCRIGGEHLRGFLSEALPRALSWGELRQRSPFPAIAKETQREWLRAFEGTRSQLTQTGFTSPVSIEITFPDKMGERTLFQGLVRLPIQDWTQESSSTSIPSVLTLHAVLLQSPSSMTGRQNATFPIREHFRQEIILENTITEQGSLPIVFYRDLIPGIYTLVVRFEDPNGVLLHKDVRQLQVPVDISESAGLRVPEGLLLTPTNPSILNRRPTVEIVPFQGLQVDRIEIEVMTTGTEIERIRYQLDDVWVGESSIPPWAYPLDLGSEPRPHTIRAVALNTAGNEIAGDTIQLNAALITLKFVY